MEYAIKVNNLCKNYGSFRLDNVCLDIPKGYITGYVGANGAGKSTSIKAILDLIKTDGGEIEIFGTKHTDLSSEQKEMIGVVYDECIYPNPLKIRQIDRFSKDIYKNWDSEKFFSLCDKFRLPYDKKVHEFSRGMKMKLSIAAAMCHGAKLLLLDEATSGLDPVIREEILDMLLEFVQDEENTVLMSSHITTDLEKVADFITFIHDGKILLSVEKDRIAEEYAILKCSAEEFEAVDRTAVLGTSRGNYGVTALVHRNRMPEGMLMEKPSIEDMLLYMTKEAKV